MFFSGIKKLCIVFFPFGVNSGMKRAHEGEIKSLLARFFAVNL